MPSLIHESQSPMFKIHSEGNGFNYIINNVTGGRGESSERKWYMSQYRIILSICLPVIVTIIAYVSNLSNVIRIFVSKYLKLCSINKSHEWYFVPISIAENVD